jgi:hypothetical protein
MDQPAKRVCDGKDDDPADANQHMAPKSGPTG